MNYNCILQFTSGVMHSGKSLLLIEKYYKLKQQGLKTFVITYYQSRYKGETITSRADKSIKTDCSFDQHRLLSLPESSKSDPCVIFIDEAQFLIESQIKQLIQYTEEQKGDVYTYGLNSDFYGNLFEGSINLLKFSHQVKYLRLPCACGNNAILNKKLFTQSQINNDIMAEYTGTCYKCFHK